MRRGALLISLALALALASCGGDDDPAADETVVDTFGTSVAPDASGDTTTPGSASASADPSEVAAWCELSAELGALGGDVDRDDPDALREAYEEAGELIDRAEEVAPEEIADAVGTNVDEFRAVVAALEDVDYDVAELDEEALERSLPDSAQANDALAAYEGANCDTDG